MYTCLSCSHLLITFGHNLYQIWNLVSLFKPVTPVYIISSYKIVEFENENYTQTSDSYSLYCYPSRSTHSISILEDNKHICIYHWIYHTKTSFLKRRHVIPPTNKNFHLLIQILLGNQVETNRGLGLPGGNVAHAAKRSPGSQRPWNATPVKPGTTLIAKDGWLTLCTRLWTRLFTEAGS